MSKKKKSNKKKTIKTDNTQKPKTKVSNKTTVTSIQNSFWVNKQLHLILIFFLSCGLYINTLNHQYAVDDSIVILRNQFTKKGISGMKGIWGEDTFTGFFGSKRNLVAGGRYRPLSLATFAIELQLFGTVIKDQNGNPILDAEGDINYQGKPFISHFVNILLYALLCIIIYLMLLQMFNPKQEQNNLKGYFIALAGALLYVTHPIHTEAIANIKGRDEIMVLLGSVLAVYWVLKAVAKPQKAMLYYFGAVLAFIFSIFSKENAVTFLVIIPASLYFFTNSSIKKIALVTLPFLIVVGIFWFGIRAPILGEAASITGGENAPATELMNDPFLKIENNRYVPFTFEERFSTVLYTWLEYIKLLVYPHPLTNDYYPKHIRTDMDLIPNFQMGKVIFSILLHLLMGVLMVLGTLKKKPFAFFILFYLATFSVVSNLIFSIGSNMAERFMFLPSVGFSALCAMGLYELIFRTRKSKGIEKAIKTPAYILAFVCILYSIKTYARNYAWYDDYVLFTTDIVNSPHSAKLNNAVSGVLQDKAIKTANQIQKKGLLEEALEKSIIATNLHPTYNNAWLLRGNANVMLGNMAELEGSQKSNPDAKNTLYLKALKHFDAGIVAYKEVTRLRPDHPDVKRNFTVVYRDRGKLLGQRLNKLDESIASIEKSLTYSIKDFESFRLLGVAYGMKGIFLQQRSQAQLGVQSHYKAINYFEQALEMNPKSVPILFNLEMAYRHLGDIAKVEQYNSMWKAIEPDYNPQAQ
ncbi:MAG: tetratricopeptide repeat protein [Saprospiraceae bacterium]|nr:tetratricopeptide repeat protein [Saprospiraceae bacterium]